MNKILSFFSENRGVNFVVRLIFISVPVLFARYYPTLIFNCVFPALFVGTGIFELIFAEKLQSLRDNRRIANGKEAETSVEIRRSMGITGIVFGIVLLCYVFLL